ncbi:armadillo repeat-containing protein 3 isoform X2 [Kryptolebias marmoratus]|uniref:armadillo repeat-containing protein 3 isoform X2 n=1 Tax=Kryptolebias marmoratus TaxID=37003 RepID=UPI0018AC905F|nr:armadillo repeat-containing protein 3 isoform X2 [Kryptolebias marmoratus]
MGRKSAKESKTPCNEPFEPLPVEIKTPATAVLLLSSPEEDILVKACEVIRTFAEKGDENKVSLLGLGALEPLCRLINHSNKLVRGNAFTALGIMATNGNVSSALKKQNAIPSIIEKLSLQEDTVLHEFATLCLASLSVDFLSRVQIFENNGLPPLISLLSSSDPDVKKNSLEIISNLVQDYKSRQAVHEFGGVPPLLELLKSEFPVIQHLALKTLRCVTADKDARGAFRNESGFEKLVDILHNKEFSDLHVEALQVVSNCLCDREAVEQIHSDGGLARLMDFVLASNIPEIQSTAVKCLTRVAQSSESCKVLHEQEAEKVLTELLSVADAGVKASACRAVAAMSVHPPSKDDFRDLGCIPAVVQLLSSENLEVREAATQTLSALTQNNQPNSLAVFEAGGHEVLVQQLDGSCPVSVASSAATLCNMAGEELIRSSILSRGGMQALAEPLKSKDPQVLISATRCVAALACDAEARAKLQRAGGLQLLVNLLQSNDREVLHGACFAVNVCASDKSSAVEMCKFGALETLQEISQSANRRNHFSDVAIISLLDSNLPVKFSLTGQLTSADIITGGFYDAGKVCSGQRVRTLEELFTEPVNQHRPIILVGPTAEKKNEEVKRDDESSAEKPRSAADDVSLQMLVKKAKEAIFPVSDETEQCAALGRLVSEAMGGAVEVEKLHEFPWVLHLSELKFQLGSNVIPIGLISKGIYCHRALLFKYLADCIEMSCTLVRGEYNRAWNQVVLFTENPSNRSLSQPRRYIVDLMHQPGALLAVGTPAALQYQTI